jgi:hypothetical protein
MPASVLGNSHAVRVSRTLKAFFDLQQELRERILPFVQNA